MANLSLTPLFFICSTSQQLYLLQTLISRICLNTAIWIFLLKQSVDLGIPSHKTLQWLSLHWMQAHCLTMAYKALCSLWHIPPLVSCPNNLSLTELFQPHQPFLYFLKPSGMHLWCTYGLCSSCSLCLEKSSLKFLLGWFPLFAKVFTQIWPTQGGVAWPFITVTYPCCLFHRRSFLF